MNLGERISSDEDSEGEGNEEIHMDLVKILEEFKDMFNLPNGLPPKRKVDHYIQLQEGENWVNVHPYKYGHTQKNEIECLVSEMLVSDIIHPSSSPFSSLVLLVKKKDGTWRFCVVYRQQNKAMVPDKFPIPVKEQLLDEL